MTKVIVPVSLLEIWFTGNMIFIFPVYCINSSSRYWMLLLEIRFVNVRRCDRHRRPPHRSIVRFFHTRHGGGSACVSVKRFRCSLTKGGWTEFGHKIQSLSKLCHNSVKCLSNDMQSTRSVRSLSRVHRDPVQTWGHWTDCRLGNPIFVPTSSNRAFEKGFFWLRIYPGQTWDLDKLWTNPGFVNSPIARPLTACGMPGQCLDKGWTWTNFGQTLDLPTCPSPAHWLLVAFWIKIGQSLDLDKLWTNPVQRGPLNGSAVLAAKNW